MRPSSESPALITPHTAESYKKQLKNVLRVLCEGLAKLAAAILIYSARVPVGTFVKWLDALYPWFESTVTALTTH